MKVQFDSNTWTDKNIPPNRYAEVHFIPALSEIGCWLDQNLEMYSGCIILADDNTHKFCLPVLLNEVPELKNSKFITFPHGEENKTLERAASIIRQLVEMEAGRNTLLLNMGGGVVSDLGGFVSSIYKRGIDYINIPTSLLAMVDASMGGKTAVDMDQYKNMLGTFYQPEAIFIYPGFLATLPPRQILSGYAEVVKHALIADADYFKYLCEYAHLPDDWSKVIQWSVNIKNQLVRVDPYDEGPRKALNFGHTIGHAVESLSLAEDVILHGEAVAAGMICETWLSHRLLTLPLESLGKITEYLSGLFPFRKLEEKNYDSLYQFMLHDKKNRDGLRMTLIRNIGQVALNQECSKELVFESFDFYNNHCRN